MLKAMNPIALLMLANTHNRLNIDVIVQSVNIREAMVNHVVLLLPQVHISSHQIQRITHEVVDPFMLRKTAVGAVVHHIETNARKGYSQCRTYSYTYPYARREKHKPRVKRNQQSEEDYRLKVDFPITPSREVVCLEIRIYTLLELIKEWMFFGVE